MLRLTSHIILSFLLLTSTIGLAVSKHYCGGEVETVSLFTDAESCCDMDGCCHNEHDFFQVKTDFAAAQIIDAPQTVSTDLLFAQVFFMLNDWQTESETEIPFSYIEISPVQEGSTTLALHQVYRL